MTLNELKLFVAVADHRNVTKTSAVLHVSQSSISHQLRSLQKELGVKLYDRGRDGIDLTRAGRRFAIRCRATLQGFEHLKDENHDGRKRRSETLKVAGSHGTAESILSGLMAQYRKSHPGARPLLRIEESSIIERMVLRSEVEIGFVISPPISFRLVVEPFSTDEIVPFASVNHPMAKKSKVSLEELARTPIVIKRSNRRKDHVERLLQKALGGRLKPLIVERCESPDAVKSAVEIGASVGLLSLPHLAREVEEGRLKVLRVPRFAMQIRRFIIYRKDQQLSSAARDFLALLRTRSRR